MITIKLKEIDGKGRIKYHHVEEGYPVEVGETLRFKWQKSWKVIDVFTTKPKKKVCYRCNETVTSNKSGLCDACLEETKDMSYWLNEEARE